MQVTVLVDGADYFARLYEVLRACRAGDWVSFTDWQGDPDELLDGPDTEVGEVLADSPRVASMCEGCSGDPTPRR